LTSSSDDLTSKLISMEANLAILKSDVKTKDARITEGEVYITELELHRAKHAIETKEMSIKISKSKVSLKNMEVNCNELECLLKNCKNDKIHMLDGIHALKDENDAFAHERDELLLQLGLLMEEKKEEEIQYLLLQDNLAAKEASVNQLKSDLVNLNTNQETLHSRANSLQESISKLSEEKKQLLEESLAANTQISSKDERILLLVQEQKALCEKIQTSDKQYLGAKKCANDLVQSSQDLEKKYMILKKVCSEQKLEIESSLKSTSDENNSQNKAFNDQLKEGQRKISALENEILAYDKKLVDVNAVMKDLKQDNLLIQKEVKSKNEQLRELESSLAKTKFHNQKLSIEQISTSTNDEHNLLNKVMNDRLEERQLKILKIENALLSRDKQLIENDAVIKELKHDNNSIQNELRSKNEELRELEDSLAKTKTILHNTLKEVQCHEHENGWIDVEDHVTQNENKFLIRMGDKNETGTKLLQDVDTQTSCDMQGTSSDAPVGEVINGIYDKNKYLSPTNTNSKVGVTEMIKKTSPSLHGKVEGLKTTLETCEKRLQSREVENISLMEQLEAERNIQIQRTKNETALVLSDEFKESIETNSVEILREQVICLALKLESAEVQKAEAVERIARERKSHAEKIKKLGESMKRFYSTVACSNSAG